MFRTRIRHACRGLRLVVPACLAIALCGAAMQAHAGVVIEGTRVVFPADQREVVVRMTNERKFPVLVEAWIDLPEDAKNPAAPVPFALTPPLFRLDAAKGQTLRIFQLPGSGPTDRERLYYLNVRDIPPKADAGEDEGQVALAFRSRIKLFHRPAKLAIAAKDAPLQLRWHADGKGVRVRNPTPYYITITAIEHDDGAKQALTGVMVAPFDDMAIELEAGKSLRPAQSFHYTILNDLGGAVRLGGSVSATP